MSLHFAQSLADYVRLYLDQDDVTLPDSAMASFVRATEGQITRIFQDHPRMRVRRNWSLEAGDNVIPVPNDMALLHTIKVNGVALTQFPPRRESEAERCGGGFINFGNCIKVWPIPTEKTWYALEMSVAIPSLLDEQQLEPNWVASYYNDVYQYGLLSEAAGYLRDPKNQQIWAQRFIQTAESIKLQGWNEKISEGSRAHFGKARRGQGGGSSSSGSAVKDHGDLSGLTDDDHPQYLTEGRGDARYDAQGTAQGLVDAHEAAADPHPDYLTSGEAEAPGTAQSLLAAHEAAADPHPAYLTSSKGDAAYEPLGASQTLLDAHEAASDPHAAAGYLQSVVAGANVTVDHTDPRNPIVATGGGITDHGALTGLEDNDHPQYLLVSAGYLQSVAAGENVTVDATDPRNPVVSASGGGLTEVETTVTSADVFLAVNTRNVLTISGLTALRTALFPAGAKGDIIEVELATDAPTNYELVIAGDTDVSMRLRDQTPVTAAEVTRLLILGEAMRWVHDGTDWVCTALDDGRIPSRVRIYLSFEGYSTANVWTRPTDRGGEWTKEFDVGNIGNASTGGISTRRSGFYRASITYRPRVTTISDQEQLTVRLWSTSSNRFVIYGSQVSSGTTKYQCTTESDIVSLGARENLFYEMLTNKGARGSGHVENNKTNGCYFSVIEIF